jgi:hypothetical protein
VVDMPDQSKFEKTIRLTRRYQQLYGVDKKTALKHAKEEIKKNRPQGIISTISDGFLSSLSLKGSL